MQGIVEVSSSPLEGELAYVAYVLSRPYMQWAQQTDIHETKFN